MWLIFGGLLYLVWLKLTGIAVPCVFYRVTGLKCPGCGITRMLIALSGFRIKEAFLSNPFLLVTLPLLLFIILYIRAKEKRGEALPKWCRWLIWIYLFSLIIFGIVRNLYAVL